MRAQLERLPPQSADHDVLSRAYDASTYEIDARAPARRGNARAEGGWRYVRQRQTRSNTQMSRMRTLEARKMQSSGSNNNMKELLSEPSAHDLSADYAPKFIKLARILRDCIQRGELPNGSLLDRNAIAAEYGVCPNTVSGAFSALSNNGYAKPVVERSNLGYRYRVVYPRKNYSAS